MLPVKNLLDTRFWQCYNVCMNNLPVISPETLTIADAYLELQNTEAVSLRLSIPVEKVHKTLQGYQVRTYMDTVFNETGYMNKYKIADALNTLIENKLEELEETELTSRKDPAELLKLAHDMRIQEYKLQIDLKKLEISHAEVMAKNELTSVLTDRKIDAAESRYKLKLQHEEEVQSKQLNSYNALLEKLMQPVKEITIINQQDY